MNVTGFPLVLAASGLIGALLVFSAGESLGSGNGGDGPRPPQDESGRGCVSFFVGVQRPGEIHVHLTNLGAEQIAVRLEIFDEVGRQRAAETYSLGPRVTRELTMRRPVPGSGLRVSALTRDLRAYAELAPDDGGEPEPYIILGCA